jgi:glycosyltransferase involved in cell wall biosynthesis
MGLPCAVPLDVGATNRPARILYEQTVFPFRVSTDVLLNPGFTAPILARCPQVTVFHDMQHKRHPEFFRWFDLPAWRFFLWASAHRSTKLIAISEETKRDLLRYYSIPRDRVRLIHNGVESRFFEIGRSRGPTDPILLCVSTLHPHKNIERLVRVFARLHAQNTEWRLVLTGMKGFQTKPILDQIASAGLTSSVEVTGWIPREELYGLYRRARAFVYPSTFEGFGLPVLEALASGIPTACSDIEPLRTISGGAALLFPPHDEEAMFHALDRLLKGGKAAEDGIAQAARFSWEAAAKATLDVLTTAAGLRAGS